jgi:hypothetical protein
MTNQLTDAQHRVADQLALDLHAGLAALGPARAGEVLLGALLTAPLTVPNLRYLSRMLDREADRRERV